VRVVLPPAAADHDLGPGLKSQHAPLRHLGFRSAFPGIHHSGSDQPIEVAFLNVVSVINDIPLKPKVR
jgi:hypothetical protein